MIFDIIKLFFDVGLMAVNVYLLYIIGQEKISLYKGVKNFTGKMVFWPKDNGKKTPCFWFYIKNEGLIQQNYTYIISDKKDFITNPLVNGEECSPGDIKCLVIEITPKLLLSIESAKSLLLVDKSGKQKKIISKKDIKTALKRYKKHIKEN